MPIAARFLALSVAILFLPPAPAALAAPDEELLGKAEHYPVARTLRQAYQPSFIVGSFSAMDSIGPSCTMAPADRPLALPRAAAAPALTYRFAGNQRTLDDYMDRQRATAVLVLKDGEIVAERYNYERTPAMRLLSNSMAKTVIALALGKARVDGLIRSFNDTAARYVPLLGGSLYGETKLVNLMRMASGARFVEDYSANDDRSRFNAASRRDGTIAALQGVTERAAPEGERFSYSGPHTQTLGLVLAAATNRTLCDYIGEQIWRPMGAESTASWLVNPRDGLEVAAGGLNATVRDYARLGWLMANDGARVGGQGSGQGGGSTGAEQIIPRDYLRAMTDPELQPEAFRPGHLPVPYFGYGLQTWLFPGAHRRFALLGIYGQAIFVDPELKLVMVHTAVGQDASGDKSGAHLGRERDALWRGIVAHYGEW